MEAAKRRALEAAGYWIGDAEDFLQLTAEERAMVELRVALSRAVRRMRVAKKITQRELAERIRSSQSRVAKIEAGSDGVSLDLSFRGFFAVGGKLSDLRRGMFAPPGGKKMTRFRTAHASGRRTSSPRRTPRTPPRS